MAATDVQTVARLHSRAFSDFFLTSLGMSFLAYYYRMFPAHDGTIALVAELGADDDVVGFVVGATNPRGFYRRLLRSHWLGFALRALVAVVRRPLAVLRILRGLTHPSANPEGQDVAGLFSVAVDPDVQGSPVARALMDAFLVQAAERGARSVFLHTDAAENERANAYYRRHGFSIRRSFETPEGRRLNEYWRELEERP